MISDYCKTNNILLYNLYCDDGYTGTNFDRPGFQQMMKDVKDGKVNTVIVKDLSRMGRNYTSVGDIMENQFADYGVRFISLGDNIDNGMAEYDSFFFAMKNVFNEMYPLDCSKKTRMALNTKAKNGQFVGSKAPYGYKKSEKDKHILEIDENVADNVKLIFSLAEEQGYGFNKIANVLRERKIPTPKEYANKVEEPKCDWNLATVKKMLNDEANRRESLSASQAADAAEKEYDALMAEAEALAAGYNYDEAIAKLNTFTGTDAEHQQAITAKKAEYTNAQSQLVEWKDVSQIPNLSFHVLMADPTRAISDAQYGGLYNRNFVTIDEFSKILEQLYAGGYILIDFDSFISTSTGVDGKESFFQSPLMLPAGKKPIMITETMVNYFNYMIDGNNDGEPDAGGAGFACKLVVDANGDIKAQYVDGSNQTLVGNYDLVPILEDFIKAHPDFSYRGARATLAVTGHEGVFGYRCNTSYIASKSQSYYDEQVAGAKEITQALREKGYTIASYTYSNQKYRDLSAKEISQEMTNWKNQVTPILGEVDVLVFARENGGINDYTGAVFTALSDTGFQYFVDDGEKPSVTINTSYVRQTRIMVTGMNMQWHPTWFTQYFDCNAVLDIAVRGSVPNS